MNYLKTLLLPALAILFLTVSCTSAKTNDSKTTNDSNADTPVSAVVNEFVEAMYKPVNFKKMAALYVNFPFVSVVRADAHEIVSIADESGSSLVTVHSYWSKSNGDKIENDFQLKLEKQGDTWKIVNSKDLSRANTMDPEAFEYGLKNGLIANPDDLWDIELLEAVKKANSEMKK